jgi:hypothetical protein
MLIDELGYIPFDREATYSYRSFRSVMNDAFDNESTLREVDADSFPMR